MRTTLNRPSTFDQYDAPTWVLTAIGFFLGCFGIVYVALHPEPAYVWALEFALVGVPTVLIVYGGYWVATHQSTRTEHWRIVKWSLCGGVVAGVLTAVYIVVELVGELGHDELGELVILGVLIGTLLSLYASIFSGQHRRTLDSGGGDENWDVDSEGPLLSDNARTLVDLALDTRAWNVLRVLLLADRPVGVETVVHRIAAIEQADPRDVRIDLIHVRLPKLVDNGLVSYDSHERIVCRTGRIATVLNASDELPAVAKTLSPVAER